MRTLVNLQISPPTLYRLRLPGGCVIIDGDWGECNEKVYDINSDKDLDFCSSLIESSKLYRTGDDFDVEISVTIWDSKWHSDLDTYCELLSKNGIDVWYEILADKSVIVNKTLFSPQGKLEKFLT